MAYKINYLPLAVQDLTDIAQYLSGFYPKTAPRVLREIRERIERLSTTPNMCEEYEHDPSYRKLVADKYLVFYRVQEVQQIVEIHRVLRGSWNLPQYLEAQKITAKANNTLKHQLYLRDFRLDLILHMIIPLKHGVIAAGVGFHHCLTVFEMLFYAAKLEIDMPLHFFGK